MNALTDKQSVILDFIKSYIATHGYPPTLREIGDKFGLSSTNGVNDHLKALERKGYIRRGDMQARSIVVVDAGSQETQIARARDAIAIELDSARTLLRRLVEAGERLPTLSAEMAVALGDARAVVGGKTR